TRRGAQSLMLYAVVALGAALADVGVVHLAGVNQFVAFVASPEELGIGKGVALGGFDLLGRWWQVPGAERVPFAGRGGRAIPADAVHFQNRAVFPRRDAGEVGD